MFTARLATALVLLAACISALLMLPNHWWAAATVPVLLAAGWEWASLAGFRRFFRLAFVVLLGASALAIAITERATGGTELGGSAETYLYAGATVFWIAIVPWWLSRRWSIRSPMLLIVIGWIVLVPCWAAIARLQADPERLLALLGVVWLSDTAAYLAGRKWGRHKLAPAISPGKTWEGVAGAGAAVAVYYVILIAAVPAWSDRGWNGAVLFAGIAILGIVGDLFESWVKRQAAVKDSGSLLPGHGGVLDRIDSLTAALPAAALLLPLAV